MNNTQDNKNPEKTHDLHYYAGHIQYDMTNLIKWLLLAVLTGLTVGFISSLFARALKFVTTYRTEHFWVFFLLPAAGLVIVFLYQKLGQDDGGTNQVLSTIRSQDDVPFHSAPLIFISTILHTLAGGSAGREGGRDPAWPEACGNQLRKLVPSRRRRPSRHGHVWNERCFLRCFRYSDGCGCFFHGSSQRRYHVLCSTGSMRDIFYYCFGICCQLRNPSRIFSRCRYSGSYCGNRSENGSRRCRVCRDQYHFLHDIAGNQQTLHEIFQEPLYSYCCRQCDHHCDHFAFYRSTDYMGAGNILSSLPLKRDRRVHWISSGKFF